MPLLYYTLHIHISMVFHLVILYLVKADARAYLEGEYTQLKTSVKAEKRRVRDHKKLGIAFVTFKKEQDAKR